MFSVEIWIEEEEEQVRKVHECCFDINDKVDVNLPQHSKILSIQRHGRKLRLYAVVDDSQKEPESIHFRIFRNDCSIDEEEYWDLRYICSVHDSRIWKKRPTLHIFEYEEYDPNKIHRH